MDTSTGDEVGGGDGAGDQYCSAWRVPPPGQSISRSARWSLTAASMTP